MVALSRQDFQAAADTIARALRTDNEAARITAAFIARDLADHFKKRNSAFRYDRFFEACGLDSFGYLRREVVA